MSRNGTSFIQPGCGQAAPQPSEATLTIGLEAFDMVAIGKIACDKTDRHIRYVLIHLRQDLLEKTSPLI